MGDTRYDCVNGECVSAERGRYATIEECQSACQPPLNYHLRVEYTTFEFDADDEGAACYMNPPCPTCGAPSGSGSGSSGDDGPMPPCITCGQCFGEPPEWYHPFTIPPNDPVLRFNAWVGYCSAHCNDPGFGCPGSPNGTGGIIGGPAGGSGMGSFVPDLLVEKTIYEVPESFRRVGPPRCEDLPICEVCP